MGTEFATRWGNVMGRTKRVLYLQNVYDLLDLVEVEVDPIG